MTRITDKMLHAVAPGVFYTNQELVSVDDTILTLLKKEAAASPLKRARLCAHPGSDALQQDMLIVSHKDTYVPPHRHIDKTETFLVLEGHADTILFDENGNVTDILPMGPHNSGRLFFYRMPQQQYHSLLIHDEWLIFVENTIGPFDPEMTENAPWAPLPYAIEEGKVYKREMERAMQEWASAHKNLPGNGSPTSQLLK